MTRYLITGVSGLLGINLAMQLFRTEEITGTYYQNTLATMPFRTLSADLTRPNSATELVKSINPEVIINCAALANLDSCSKDPKLAHRLNAALPGELAEIAVKMSIPFVHISTDAVFDGQQGNYAEDDQPNPINVYAQTKLDGEFAVLNANPSALIARVNFYGWSLGGKRSLAEFFFNQLQAGNKVTGFTDIYFCPMLVNHLVDILIEMQQKGLKGLYHVVGPECISKFEFGKRIAQQFGFDASTVQGTSWKDAGLTAVRAPNLCLNTAKVTQALGRQLPDIDTGIQVLYAQYKKGYPELLQAQRSE